MNENESAKLTFECYGNKTVHDFGHEDLNMDEILHAFYGVLVAHTWLPSVVLHGMKEFAEEMLPITDPDYKEEVDYEVD